MSGFFGGLSGHQGALRSAVLTGAGLSSAAFVATGSVAAFMVDVSRLGVYSTGSLRDVFAGTGSDSLRLVAAATASALVGTYLSSRFLKKVTIQTIRRIVGVLLALLAAALISGLV